MNKATNGTNNGGLIKIGNLIFNSNVIEIESVNIFQDYEIRVPQGYEAPANGELVKTLKIEVVTSKPINKKYNRIFELYDDHARMFLNYLQPDVVIAGNEPLAFNGNDYAKSIYQKSPEPSDDNSADDAENDD